MDNKQQKECHLLIKKYKELKQEAIKVKYRNKIYLILKDFIIIQMKSVLSKWKKYVPEDELLSNSWDVFVFCLDYYKPIVFSSPIPHFEKYIKYWLLMHLAKRDESVYLPLDELEDTLMLIDNPENIAFGKLLKLYRIREVLSKEDDKIIWDDSFLSLRNTDGKRDGYSSLDKIKISSSTYYRMRRAFADIIRFVLEE